MDDQRSARLHHGRQHRLHVDRSHCTQIYHLHAHPLACEFFRCLQGVMQRQPIRDHRRIASLTFDLRRTDRHHVVVVGHLAAHRAVRPLVLQHHHRVVIPDGGLQQPLGVVRRGRHHDFQPGRVREVRLHALGVVQPSPHVASVGRAQHHRHVQLPLGSVPDARRLPDDLIHRGPDEIGELNLCDRPKTLHRSAHRNACYRGLRQWGIEHALLAELLYEPLRRQEHAPATAHVLAHHEHGRVAEHLLADRRPNRLYHRERRHNR